MSRKNKNSINSKPRILQLLMEQCLLHETIEVHVNKEENFFNTRIIDQFPALDPVESDEEKLSNIKAYDPFSFLKQGRCLLLEDVNSDNSRVKIKEGDKLLIRFFTGHNAFEADVPFEQFIDINGKPVAIQVAFPQLLSVIHTRKEIRVKALVDSKIALKVYGDKLPDFESRIVELSASGLSFCLPRQLKKYLPMNSKVGLALSLFGEEEFTLDSSVCHFNAMPREECCAKIAECDSSFGNGKTICGVDFVFADNSQKELVNELIFVIQREYLLKEKENLIKFNQELGNQVRDKTAQLREQDLQLLEMDRIAGIATLAAGIAHGINTPLAFLQTYTRYVKKSVNKMVELSKFWDDKPIQESIMKEYNDYRSHMNFDNVIDTLEDRFVRINKGIERIKEIVKNLKSFSRVDRENIGSVNLNECIEDTIKVLSAFENDSVEIIREFREIPLLECSVSDMYQCLHHILKNSLDAVEENGIVKVSSAYIKKNNHIIIKVVDNGTGMSPNVLKQVFNPFFTTKPVGSGTGLGLSIVERIIKHHGGKIEISSKEKLGTTLTMTLPVKRVLKD